jgi:hypothetical protein
MDEPADEVRSGAEQCACEQTSTSLRRFLTLPFFPFDEQPISRTRSIEYHFDDQPVWSDALSPRIYRFNLMFKRMDDDDPNTPFERYLCADVTAL